MAFRRNSRTHVYASAAPHRTEPPDTLLPICALASVDPHLSRTSAESSLLFTPYTFIGYHYDFIQNLVHSLLIMSAFYCFVRKMAVYA